MNKKSNNLKGADVGRLNKKSVFVLIASYGGLMGFLSFTNPLNLPAIGLILPILWSFVCMFLSFRMVINIFYAHSEAVSWRKNAYCAVAAGIPTLLLLFRSLNQLTVKDTVLFLLFASAGLFYIGRLRFTQKTDTT